MWAHAVSALIGIWLMAAPAVLQYGGAAATNQRIVGPMIVSFGFVAVWQITRSLRLLNLLLGAWLVIAPLFINHPSVAALVSITAGIPVALLALVRGKHDTDQFAGGWIALFKSNE